MIKMLKQIPRTFAKIPGRPVRFAMGASLSVLKVSSSSIYLNIICLTLNISTLIDLNTICVALTFQPYIVFSINWFDLNLFDLNLFDLSFTDSSSPDLKFPPNSLQNF